MIAYHVDRNGSLRVGQVINPIIKDNIYEIPRLSNWGLSLINDSVSDFSSINTHNIENRAESIRKNAFPDIPSRLSSFFGVQELEHLSSWKNILHFDNNAKIYMISYEGSAPLLDASFLNVNATNNPLDVDPFSLSNIERLMQSNSDISQYWSGVFSENPLPELLIPLPVTIIREVSFDSLP